jgi:hypothetical protein
VSPIPSPVLILRNCGLTLRRASAAGPLPRLVGLAAANAQPQPVGDDGDVFGAQDDQLRPAQRADEAEQQQRAVTPAASRLVAGRPQLAQHRQRQRGSFWTGHPVAARTAADIGCRDAQGSTAGRCPVAFAKCAAADRIRRGGGRGPDSFQNIVRVAS